MCATLQFNGVLSPLIPHLPPGAVATSDELTDPTPVKPQKKHTYAARQGE